MTRTPCRRPSNSTADLKATTAERWEAAETAAGGAVWTETATLSPDVPAVRRDPSVTRCRPQATCPPTTSHPPTSRRRANLGQCHLPRPSWALRMGAAENDVPQLLESVDLADTTTGKMVRMYATPPAQPQGDAKESGRTCAGAWTSRRTLRSRGTGRVVERFQFGLDGVLAAVKGRHGTDLSVLGGTRRIRSSMARSERGPGHRILRRGGRGLTAVPTNLCVRSSFCFACPCYPHRPTGESLCEKPIPVCHGTSVPGKSHPAGRGWTKRLASLEPRQHSTTAGTVLRGHMRGRYDGRSNEFSDSGRRGGKTTVRIVFPTSVLCVPGSQADQVRELMQHTTTRTQDARARRGRAPTWHGRC